AGIAPRRRSGLAGPHVQQFRCERGTGDFARLWARENRTALRPGLSREFRQPPVTARLARDRLPEAPSTKTPSQSRPAPLRTLQQLLHALRRPTEHRALTANHDRPLDQDRMLRHRFDPLVGRECPAGVLGLVNVFALAHEVRGLYAEFRDQ